MITERKQVRNAVLGSSLRCVRLSRCLMLSNEAIFALTRLERLRSLYLSGARRLTSECISALVTLGNQLQAVDLSRFSWVDDAALRALAAACPNLTSLNLSGCFLVSYLGIEVLEKKCPLKFSEQPAHAPPSVWGSALSSKELKAFCFDKFY